MKFMDKLPENGYKLIKWHVKLLQVHRGVYPICIDNDRYYEYEFSDSDISENNL